MAGNTIGTLFRLTTFGESHGPAVGGVIDGCPPGIAVSEQIIQEELDLRKPGTQTGSTTRREEDKVEILSGVFKGLTTGMPLAFLIRNTGQKSDEYDDLENIYRPSHADYAVEKRFGTRDHRGGGRLSGRETVARVAAGAIAKVYLEKEKIEVIAYTSSIGGIHIEKERSAIRRKEVLDSPVRCPDEKASLKMMQYLEEIREQGETAGGTINCIVRGVPAGLGDPVFDKLHALLAKATLSIGGVKGFEIGEGFAVAQMKGSEHNDEWINENGVITTASNHSGGVQGGISNGETIWFRVAFKPVSSIDKEQKTVDRDGNEIVYHGGGRHDVCIVPRAVPVVEAMTALVIVDQLLLRKCL